MTSPAVKCLIVDDLEENILSLEALLRRDGLETLKARSGEEALELLLRHEVALALLDVQMPGMDGFELAEFLRGNERTRHIPIIFVTAGSADAQRRFRGYEAGAVDFIQKPIEAEVLRSKAEVFFDLHRQRQIVAAQRDALETAAQALKEADRRKDVFIAVLAHELRNPVAALHAGMHLLKKRADTDQAAYIRKRMERQLAHLRRLVDDLLDTSRIVEGKISLQKEHIDLATILHSAIEASQANIDAANHSFTADMPSETVWLVADHTRVAQIVANLLNNAARYTPPGGTISLEARREGEHALIAVRDNGLGIPPELQARIFEIFAQVEGHQDRAAGGLGIGLALVRQLVDLHRGSIKVTSDGPGQGSCFTVRIPLSSTGA